MLKKIFRSQKSGQAAFLLMIASVLSYAAGLLRDRTLANTFGATKFTDAYNASFLIPDFLFNLFIAGALSVAFIPIFASYLKTDEKEADKIASTIITFGTLLLGGLGIIFFFLMPYLVPHIFTNLDASNHEMIITMTRILLISPILFSISNALGSILITHKHFLAYALSGFVYNIGIIIGIVLFNEQFGIYSAAIGAIIGAVLHLGIRLLNIFTVDYKFQPQLSLKHAGIRKIFKLMIPKTIQLISWQVVLWVYTITAYKLEEGSVAAFNYARNLQSFPVSLFGIAFATAIFPFLSDHAHSQDTKRFSDDFQMSLEKILFFVIPASLGMLLLHKEILTIILFGGVFDEAALNLTASVLFIFILSIPIESMIHLFARAFYAYKNTLMPMIFALIATVFNIGFCVFFAERIGIQAVSMAFLGSTIIQLVLLGIFLAKHLGEFKIKDFIIKLMQIGIAATAMSLAVIYIPQFISISFLTLQIIRVIVGTSIYLALALIFKCKELTFFSDIFKKITTKNRV
ncbi:murein biosynthesis integral membrane protein MurJ [Patescibacteria group bacterium]|nr:murein biosynthesis integral membrane protein MurJ [Patescibacteria group bacterium]